MKALETMQKHYQQRDLDAREWKEKGGRVAGYFCDIVPEELILAAGFFPLRLSGDPWGGTQAVDVLLFRPAGPPEGFVHSILNMLLTGKYDFLDYLIIPRTRVSIQRLYSILVSLKESNPELKLPELYFFDNLHTTFLTSQLYNRDRMYDLKKKLEEWSGKEITDEALQQAISIGNENKMLLKKVADLRAAEMPRISGVEALQIIGSSMFMLKGEHNKLLRQFLEEADRLPTKDGVRLFIESSPLDNLQFYENVESYQAIIVGEDNCWGNRYSDVPVDTSLNPMEAIVNRYNNKSPCPYMYPLKRRVEYLLQNTLDVKAQGVVFNLLEFDDYQRWEIPDQIKTLEKEGIPALYLKGQPYLISEPELVKTEVRKFIESY